MVAGVPLVIGAKKGFPNFNELTVQSKIQVIRRLEFRRSTNSAQFPDETNQMYVVGISNVVGARSRLPWHRQRHRRCTGA